MINHAVKLYPADDKEVVRISPRLGMSNWMNDLVKLKQRGLYRVTIINLLTDDVIMTAAPIIARSPESAKYDAANMANIAGGEYDNYDILVEFVGYIREKKS